jgi:seryl-tRNA synthetase
MLDIKWINANQPEAEALLAKRGVEKPLVQNLCLLSKQKKGLLSEIQSLQQKRNEGAGAKSEEAKSKARALREKIAELEKSLEAVDLELTSLMDSMPNFPSSDVPEGFLESDNKVLSSWSRDVIKPCGPHHLEVLEQLGLIELTQTVKMSGSRFVSLKGDAARLRRALANFMVDLHVRRFGFTEVAPPYMVHYKAMYNSGQLPKFENESFATTLGHRLIPTAEVPLVNFVADMNLDEGALPLRMVAATPCFRSEAGSAGKDTRGIIRLHQFTKVELVSIVGSEKSEQEHDYLLQASSSVLKELGLAHRTVLLSCGDMGFSAHKTYDLEVWMPGEGKYREIASCSNCGDFQARRMRARYRSKSGELQYLHTLNSSGLAIERTIAAIVENFFDGQKLHIPIPLRPYMGIEAIPVPS